MMSVTWRRSYGLYTVQRSFMERMKIPFLSKMVNEQFNFLMPKVLLADITVFVVCLPFYGLEAGVPLGLLLGTAAMTANFLLLGYSAEHAVERPSKKSAQRYMFSFYLIRLTVMGAALAAGFAFEIFNPVTTFLPLLYPKTFYTADAALKEFRDRKKSLDEMGSDGKDIKKVHKK
ncbi:MAG: ATP synthase subunit I [Ruminococcus sp.]|nr:ATP synthase subunit I [Ruminococcus sp.]